jgi:hypothetical protein
MILAIVVLATHAMAEQRLCHIKSLIGNVTVRRGNAAAWIDAKPRMQLREKEAIRTFVESEVELETSEGSIIKVAENSTLELSTLQGKNEVQSTRVKILSGSVVSNIRKFTNSGSRFDFETPTALASIRGTLLGLEVTGERTQIKVYEGRVMVFPVGAANGTELKENQMASVAKGQKNVEVSALKEKPPAGFTPSGSSSDTSGTAPVVDSAKTAGPAKLLLSVGSPADGGKFSKPLIPVSGSATPGATVSITPPGVRIPVLSNGLFSTQAPVPDEVGEYTIVIEASLDAAVQKIVRRVNYQPEIRFVVSFPQDRQTVNTTLITVKGEVYPAKGSEVSVAGRKMSITPDGAFSGMLTIPDEEGEVRLEFEVNAGGKIMNQTRTIRYKRGVDTYAPVIQGVLPKYAKQRQLCLPVYDRTVDDEILFYYEINGIKDYQRGAGSGTFCFNLEPGINSYAVWAEDKAKNRSVRLSERIAYVETSVWYIKVRKPSAVETLRLPPQPPDDPFEPEYQVDFSVENLPGDDMHLIREVRVINQATGQTLTQSTFTDHYLDFAVKLKRGCANTIVIEVQDCNGNKKVQQAVINLK